MADSKWIKTKYRQNKMHFKQNFSSNSLFQISYYETNVKQAVHTKFLGLNFENHINWKTRIDKIIQ